MMYEPVMKLFQTQMEMQMEGEIMKAVQEVGVVVDKDELIKALNYDRQQYQKGYEDGKRESEWIPCSERLPDVEYISGKDPNKGHYLTCDHDGNVGVLPWCEGWNCYRHLNGSAHKDYEITDIVAWMPLPEAYKESEE